MKLIDSTLYNNDLEKVASKYSFSALYGKRIFITGGLGLIGSAVVDLLLTINKLSGDQIDITVGGRRKEKFVSRYGEETTTLHFKRYEATEDLDIDSDAFDYIIYASGASSPNLYMSQPVETMEGNIIGIRNILEYAKSHLDTKILYVSSSEVYGTKTIKDPFKEDMYGLIDHNNIRFSYGVGKIASEMLTRSYFKEYNVESIIVRPGHIFGPSANEDDQRVASLFMRKALKGEDLVLNSTGLQKRSYCYSVDCASAILYALIHGKNGESYNIGSNRETSILEMSQILAEEGGVNLSYKVPTKEEKEMSNPMDYAVLDSQKLESIGFEYSFTPKEGLINSLRILKEII
ncbi:MAG: NAD-dependent epimerase/dehydratase family protein [Candidatus Ornithospirochaeta sp.]